MRFPPVLPLFIAGVVVLAVAGCGGGGGASQSDRDKAVDEAQAVFLRVHAKGVSAGPCISESLPGLPDWVADVAHDPREPIDDRPANQCQRYRSGQAHHFVELNIDGQLIRAE